MYISIHQPDYLPWNGYFNKIKETEKFVFLDTASYSRDGFHNRNKIKTGNGTSAYLTIPVPRSEIFKPMRDAALPLDTGWAESHWRSIENHYRRAPHWQVYATFFEVLYASDVRKYTTLADLNAYIIEQFADMLGLGVTFVRASDLELGDMKGSDQILAICKKLGADKYLSGLSGKKYLDMAAFAKEGIEVVFQDYHQKPSGQLFGEFIPGLSIVDLLCNEGRDAVRFIS